MKRLYALFVLLMLSVPYAQGKNINISPYKIPSITTKTVNVLEWRLVQVNLKIVAYDNSYFVFFDNNSHLFMADKFIDANTLATTSPTMLRDTLLSSCGVVSAAIGSEFPEFRERGNKDLVIKFMIGDSSGRHFASYKSGGFSFTDDYYDFRKEHGK